MAICTTATTVAADFIADEFRDIGVEAIGQSYFRSFEIQADLFPSTPSLSINNTELQIGIDFIPFPGSASGSGATAPVLLGPLVPGARRQPGVADRQHLIVAVEVLRGRDRRSTSGAPCAD